MKNKQHEYILKAFINSRIPMAIRRYSPELIAIDSVVGGYCSQLIHRAKFIELPSSEIISKTEKAVFSELINQSTGMEKDVSGALLTSFAFVVSQRLCFRFQL